MKDLPLLVLAGGFGTRLQSVVSDVPKPLAPINERPFLDFLLQNWRDAGIADFVFLLHHKADLIEAFLERAFAKPEFEDLRYETIIEVAPLGTGGSLANALKVRHMSDEFLAVNSDTWLPDGMARMRIAAAPSMAVVEVSNANRYGQVKFDQGVIKSFQEKSTKSESGWINAGLYRLHAEHLSDWNGEFMSLEAEILPKLVKSGQLHAVQFECPFIDIGVPADYRYFQEMVGTQEKNKSASR